MSTAAERALAAADRDRTRHLATLLDNPYDQSFANFSTRPGWSAFFGSLDDQAAQARAAGMSTRVNAGSLLDGGGGGPQGPSLLYPTDRPQIAGNAFLNGTSNDAKVSQAAGQDYVDARQQQAIDAMKRSYAEQVQAGQNAPLSGTSTVTQTSPGAGQPDLYAIRPTATDPRQQLLDRLPIDQRAALEKHYSDLDTAQTNRAVASGNLALNVQKEHAAEASNPLLVGNQLIGPALMGANGQPLQGQEALARLPPAVRNQVQGVLDGRQAMPAGTASKDPYWKSIIQIANQVDPTFDAADYNARYKTRQDFTSGPTANQITSINQTIGHLADFSDDADKLGNGSMDWMNGIQNHLTRGGSSRGVALNNFNTRKNGLTSELTRVWRQAGGTEQDIKDWAATLGDTKSPQELHGALNTIAGMLESKLSALQDRYRQGMGTNAVSTITDQARQQLDKLEGRASAPAAAGGPQGAPQAAAPAGAQAGPQDGTQQAIPGVPGGVAEFRGGKWIRVR